MRVTKFAFTGIIEHVSDLLFTITQIIFAIWPLFIITALVYALPGRMSLSAFARRVRQSLLPTWVVLFFIWLFTLFAPNPNLWLFPEPWNTLVFLGGFALLLLSEASRLGLLRRRLRARVELRHTHSLQRLKTMDPYDFENLVAETYRSLGYDAQQVGKSGDHGVDVRLVTPDGKKWVGQVKRYSGAVGEGVIRELYGTMVSEKAARALLVTTAQITEPAREWARNKPIDLVDGPAFIKLMDEAQRRAEGTFLNRLSVWFEKFLQSSRPPGLREHSIPETDPALSITQPVRVRVAGITSPERASPPIGHNGGAPVCPNCGVTMVPRPSRGTSQPERPLYRCRNYPDCRVVLEQHPH